MCWSLLALSNLANIKYLEKFEDTKGAIRNRISKKNRKHNGQKKKCKRTNNDRQNIHHKTKDRVTRTPLKTGGELRCSGRVPVPAPLMAPF